jgi:hypothetical protein
LVRHRLADNQGGFDAFLKCCAWRTGLRARRAAQRDLVDAMYTLKQVVCVKG